MLNAIYKNETNVIFSLKLNDEAAHGKFFGRKRTVRRSGRSFEHKLDRPFLWSKLDSHFEIRILSIFGPSTLDQGLVPKSMKY